MLAIPLALIYSLASLLMHPQNLNFTTDFILAYGVILPIQTLAIIGYFIHQNKKH
ncbi:hypothetical protein FC86_GL001063 [Holzapfeliella floricola DSM 23037 = JCM 16512]|uniref:DUF4017 domain-containing protein n=1 Tax=Holzapfeliella floricola DSM 23037 = JCM 16512 TaxID=1423744 RepID=A0A0R2DML8_9LACO|nr:hypothetical protein FC86_GL001063 [Holzapfeliella floricola DSM 23037 = JCM 16512]